MASGIIKRGWTAKAIEQFLGEPDETRRNPRYKRSAPMRLYRMERVEACERSEAFQAWLSSIQGRRTAALASARDRRDQTLAIIGDISVRVPDFPNDEALLERACLHYNKRNERFRRPGPPAIVGRSRRSLLDKVCVDYLRHACDEYDPTLKGLFRRIGAGQAYVLLKTKVLEAISARYPTLGSECERQIRKMRRMNADAVQAIEARMSASDT